MVRKLETIEKEMGYCEIKLERERRLRKQALYLQSNVEALEGVLEDYPGHARERSDVGRSIASEDLGSIARSLQRRHTKTYYRRVLRSFLAQATYAIFSEEKEFLLRELELVQEMLHSFSGFENRREGLLAERHRALKGLGLADSSRIRKFNEDFQKVEREWNSLTEDLLNLDEALFHIDRNLDYLGSARAFMISARNSFDIQDWLEGGYLSDLFRHSAIGRAREMLEGADRNLKLAEKEFICLANIQVDAEQFHRALVPFFRELFDDLFVKGKFEGSLAVIEECLGENSRLLDGVREKRRRLERQQGKIEKSRDRMFSEMGPEHRRTACPEAS